MQFDARNRLFKAGIKQCGCMTGVKPVHMCVLFVFDRNEGMNTFTLRPVCTEAGSVGHLVTAFLTSDSTVANLVLSKVCSRHNVTHERSCIVSVCDQHDFKTQLLRPRTDWTFKGMHGQRLDPKAQAKAVDLSIQFKT